MNMPRLWKNIWGKGVCSLKYRADIEARSKENQRTGKGPTHFPKRTRKVLSEISGIGETTMGKIMFLADHASPFLKEALERDEISINRAYLWLKDNMYLSGDALQQAAIRMSM